MESGYTEKSAYRFDLSQNPIPFRDIPFEIWINHIISYVNEDVKKSLRLTCRSFLLLVSQLWKPWVIDEKNSINNRYIQGEDLERVCKRFQTFVTTHPGWPTRIFGIKTEVPLNCQIDEFKVLDAMTGIQAINIISYYYSKAHLIDQHINSLPTSITSIKIFATTSSMSENMFQNMKTRLTNLKRLSISYSYDADKRSIKNYNNLPSTIESLHICGGSENDLGNDSFQSLPKNLTELTLIGFTHVTDDLLCSIPKSVTKLVFAGLPKNDKNLQYLSKDLTFLDMGSTEYAIRECDDELHAQNAKLLPRQLKTLKLTQYYDIIRLEAFECFPQNLTALNLDGVGTLSNKVLEILPKTLVTLGCISCYPVSKFPVDARFPSLKHLNFSYCSCITWDGIKDIPSTVEELFLINCGINRDPVEKKKIPPYLTYLDISYNDDIGADLLLDIPSKLLELRIKGCGRMTLDDNFNDYVSKLSCKIKK